MANEREGAKLVLGYGGSVRVRPRARRSAYPVASGERPLCLIEAAGRLAACKDLRVLRARGAELETTFPFGVVRQALEPPLAGLSPDERAALFEGAAALARPLFEGAEPLPRNGARFARKG
jgi:hypothetical protein